MQSTAFQRNSSRLLRRIGLSARRKRDTKRQQSAPSARFLLLSMRGVGLSGGVPAELRPSQAARTDTGKTTFTKARLDHIPRSERLAIIEDTIELRVDHPNAIRFEARRSQTDADGNITVPAVSIRDLVKATLRHRPDRLIIGEVRGAEALDLLDALNTGHAGSISTIHANSATMALSRLASLALRAGVDIPYVALQRDIGELIDLVVHIERRDGQRFVSEVLRIEGFAHTTQLLTTE
jgi:pilus assembly protein CpaF